MSAKRYEVRKNKDGIVLYYQMGYTKVECNSKTGRTIINNETSDKWIAYQVDEIFGLGTYKKLNDYILFHTKTPNPGNPHCVHHCIVAEYLPKQAKKDIKAEMPKDKSDLIGKYFK